VEVKRNAKVKKLEARRVIALHKVEEQPPAGSKRKKAAPTQEEK
jgi:hypothetical protein